MVDRRIKKSELSVQRVVQPSDTFDFVRSGHNFKISFTDLLLNLGAIGNLLTKGEILSFPVLDKDGSDNYIRNLIQGLGIKMSFTLFDGIQIEHGFLPGDAGTEVLYKPTDEEQMYIRNIVPGEGISVAPDGRNVLVSLSGGATTPSNVVVVNSMADFPDPVGGVITLGADSAYLVAANLETDNRFVASNRTLLYAEDSSVGSLTYTGTGYMFTATSVSFKIKSIGLTCPTAGLLNIDGDGSNVFQLVDCTVSECQFGGLIQNLAGLQITDCALLNITTDGFTFGGVIGIMLGVRNLINISDGVLFSLTSTLFTQGFTLETCFIDVASPATFLDGLPDSGNMAPGALGAVLNTRFSNDGTILNNITDRDARWSFQECDEIKNSVTSALAVLENETISIPSQNVPEKIGPNWTFPILSRFEGDPSGTLIYTGLGGRIDISITITANCASNETFAFRLYKNGFEDPGAAVERFFEANDTGNVTMIWKDDDAVTDDEYEVFVECLTDNEDIEIIKLVAGISG